MRILIIAAYLVATATSCRTSKDITKTHSEKDSVSNTQLQLVATTRADSVAASTAHSVATMESQKEWDREVVIEEFCTDDTAVASGPAAPALTRRTTIREKGKEATRKTETQDRKDSVATSSAAAASTSYTIATSTSEKRSEVEKHKQSAPFELSWAWMCGFVALLLLLLIAWRRLKRSDDTDNSQHAQLDS